MLNSRYGLKTANVYKYTEKTLKKRVVLPKVSHGSIMKLHLEIVSARASPQAQAHPG
jgi:hypothetical protein